MILSDALLPANDSLSNPEESRDTHADSRGFLIKNELNFDQDAGSASLVTLDKDAYDSHRSEGDCIRGLEKLAHKVRKGWREHEAENGVVYYERPMGDDPGNIVKQLVEISLERKGCKATVSRLFLTPDRKEIPCERTDVNLSPSELLRLLSPEMREDAIKEKREIIKDNEAAEKEALAGATPIMRVKKTEDTTSILKEELGIEVNRGRSATD